MREDKPPVEWKIFVRQSAVSAHVSVGSGNNADYGH